MDVQSIDNITVDPPKSNGESKLEAKLLNPDAEKVKNERGALGHLWGARSEKSGNIAGILVVFCLATIVFVFYSDQNSSLSMTPKDILSAFSSLITLALGYLFGRNSRLD